MIDARGLGAALALSLVVAVTGARAQTARQGGVAEPIEVGGERPRASPPPDDTRAWISVGVGPDSDQGDARVGGIAAIWATHGAFAASVRAVGVSRLFEVGDVGDISVLVGAHAIRERRLDGVIGVGLGESPRHDVFGNFSRTPVIAIGGQLLANYAVVGIGIEGFAGLWSTRHYYGVGLTLAVGGF